MSEFAIRVHEVEKTFHDIRALDGVSFDVPERSVFGLLGPNGAGKTTLFSIIADFLKADAGHVEVLGIDVRHIAELQGRMTILPQDASFQSNVPILEQLVFFRLLDGKTRKEAEREVFEALDLVGLKDYAKRGVRALSHGMLKRLGIAQAFLGKPEVILLDEPTSGLDPANARQIRDLVRELKSSTTILISSHNLHELEGLCTHAAILHKGRLVTSGTLTELMSGGQEFDFELSRPLSPPEQDALSRLPGVTRVDAYDPPRYLLSFTLEGGQTSDDLLRGIQRALLDMNVTPRRITTGQTLEKQFLKLTEEAEKETA